MAKKYLDKTGLNYFFGKIKALIPKKDNSTITENSNGQLQTVGVIDQKTSSTNKFWTGTLAEYDAITTKDPNTFYTITDDYVEIPTKTSELTNDSGFVTSSGTVSTATTANKTKGTLTIQANGTTVKTFNGSSSVTANITIPTKFSDLEDDSPYDMTEWIYENQYPVGAIYITTSSGFTPYGRFEGEWELVKTYSGGELIAYGTVYSNNAGTATFNNNVTFAFSDIVNDGAYVTNYVDGILTHTSGTLLVDPKGIVGLVKADCTLSGLGGAGIGGLWWKGNFNALPTGVELCTSAWNALLTGPIGASYGGSTHSFQYKVADGVTETFFVNPTATPYGGTFKPAAGGTACLLSVECYAKAGATYVWKRVL